MDHPRYFKVLADLSHFYTDHRSSCHLFVNVDKMKVVNDLKLHITKLFKISNFDIRYMNHHLPDAEDIRILKDGDTVHLIKLSTDKDTVEVENNQNSIEEQKKLDKIKVKSKQKRKKVKNHESTVEEPMDFYELTPNSTSSPNSKEENEEQSAPANENVSHVFTEKVDYFETLEHKSKKQKLDEATPKLLRMNKTFHPLCKLEKTTNIVKTIIASKPDGKKISNVTIDVIPTQYSFSGDTTMELEDKLEEEHQLFKSEANMVVCQTPLSNNNNNQEVLETPNMNNEQEMQETPIVNNEQEMQETPIIDKEQEICDTPSNKDKDYFVNTLNVNLSKSELTDISDLTMDSTSERGEPNRKRKRVRKRKNNSKNQASGIPSFSMQQEQPKVIVPFKPPNTQGTPLSHIKFDDDQHEEVILIDSSISMSEQKNEDTHKTTILTPNSNSSTVGNVINESNCSTPSKFQPLEPKPNDIIVFKKLKIGNDFTPVLSDPITATVEWFDGKEISLVIIEGETEFGLPGGKFTLALEHVHNPDLRKTLLWNTLIEPFIKRD